MQMHQRSNKQVDFQATNFWNYIKKSKLRIFRYMPEAREENNGEARFNVWIEAWC
ncbi:hypothetical protein E1A91_A07G144800v1 [Gossypium mustelinum]|uniref:Uncharacterized protein n=1 Tax=Gossypium mustelinum TaxID=34275 RepID=A0A5D2YLB0_GOSMU|nr:hypothetical protein E1A91_A07G144800v1 [Gossypium mustelinum]